LKQTLSVKCFFFVELGCRSLLIIFPCAHAPLLLSSTTTSMMLVQTVAVEQRAAATTELQASALVMEAAMRKAVAADK
jgi:hypothetical protein